MRGSLPRKDRKPAIGALIAAVLAAALAPASAAGPGGGGAAPDRFDRVVIDAGHGGDDQGAGGPSGLLEKNIVLDVARRLATRLRDDGLEVVMTRDGDHAVSLEQRAAVANESRGELFLSIHANAAPSPKARGIETFFVSLHASDEAAQRVATRENSAFRSAAASVGGADPVAAILGDLTVSEHLAESNEFARLAHEELAAIDRHPSRGVKQAPFYVLMGVQMPATLVEIGFITNPQEERALASKVRQEQIADALARAVHEFGRRYDARHGVAREGGPSAPSGGS
ncbi:MAG TPA: N-acetylmuramoyl-L-alanine amidase [Myxococcota bacterium]|nr:N-acetylmuramoyl-L-alanine amidase [Myxococcota bacterium]